MKKSEYKMTGKQLKLGCPFDKNLSVLASQRKDADPNTVEMQLNACNFSLKSMKMDKTADR